MAKNIFLHIIIDQARERESFVKAEILYARQDVNWQFSVHVWLEVEEMNVKEAYKYFGERSKERQRGEEGEVKRLKRIWFEKSYHFVHDSCSKLIPRP